MGTPKMPFPLVYRKLITRLKEYPRCPKKPGRYCPNRAYRKNTPVTMERAGPTVFQEMTSTTATRIDPKMTISGVT